jgi:1,4-dihydroxy-2-naphthoyl-CoA synthase
VTEWWPSGPQPGKDGPGILSRAAQIAINRPEVRDAFWPTSLFELPNHRNAPVIILTAASGPDGVSPRCP